MIKYSKTNEIKHLAPPPRKAVTSHGQGFWGAAHGIIVDDYRLNSTCHCEGAAHGIILDDYRLNLTCHCEGAAHANFVNKYRRCAFTLAETLITLMVIGVVAALTIPALMQQIGDYTLQKQKDVFSKKWAEGLRQMRVDGKLETKYASTEEFINEMQKYFKIGAVCKPDNLAGCFAEKITSYESGEAEEFEVKDLKSAKNFNKSEEDSDVYGIKFSDGTSMLLAYRKGCKDGISEGDTKGNHTACLLYVYDVNANKSPNSYGGNTGVTAKDGDNDMSDDRRNQINKGRDMVGNASITKGNAYGLDFEIIGNTVYSPDTYCPGGSDDYWTCASNYCKSLGGRLANNSELSAIGAKIYPCPSNGYDHYCEPDKNSALWSIVDSSSIWTSDRDDADGEYTSGMGFYEVYSMIEGYDRSQEDISALCVK